MAAESRWLSPTGRSAGVRQMSARAAPRHRAVPQSPHPRTTTCALRRLLRAKGLSHNLIDFVFSLVASVSSAYTVASLRALTCVPCYFVHGRSSHSHNAFPPYTYKYTHTHITPTWKLYLWPTMMLGRDLPLYLATFLTLTDILQGGHQGRLRTVLGRLPA